MNIEPMVSNWIFQSQILKNTTGRTARDTCTNCVMDVEVYEVAISRPRGQISRNTQALSIRTAREV